MGGHFSNIDQGADSNFLEEGGWPPLRYAARCGDLLKVKILLSYNDSDPNLRNESDCRALHYAASNGHIEIVPVLLQREGILLNIQDISCKSHTIGQGYYSNHLQIAKILIEAKARTNLKDCEGNTVLHYDIDIENYGIGCRTI